MNFFIPQAVRAYIELFQTGAIHSSVESDKLILNMKANVTGDILICIGPKEGTGLSYPEVIQLIQTDSELTAKKKQAFNTLEQKFKGLMLVPKRLIWAINFLFYFVLLYFKSDQITEFIRQQNFFSEMGFYSFLIAISMGTILFRKRIGFMLLKPLLTGLLHFVIMIRRIRNRKVAE